MTGSVRRGRRQLIAEHYPWFLRTYDALPKSIMRADAVRTARLVVHVSSGPDG